VVVPDLARLGWDADWTSAFEPHAAQGLVPGRVSIQHRGAYDVLAEAGELRARASGRLRHDAASPAELPVVGDWVAVARDSDAPTIQAVLPRRTVFSRRAPHDRQTDSAREQIVAANVDVVFVTSPLGEDVHVDVLERYLTLAWESGARPVILLTKADLEDDPDSVVATLESLGGEVPVVAVSARTGFGLDAVRSQLPHGRTGALLGPSGAGKSTLVNALVGEELLDAAPGGRTGGQHTTTRRQLVSLPDAGLLIDNPGMREVHLWLADEGLEDAFPEIGELEAECRFSDCTHGTEPGCAVRAALEDGTLAPERWERYRALRDELDELQARLAQRERPRARRRRPGEGGSS
jgi:ribosome biogenesis GTPase / thiamine phosphate phosphatase